MTLKTDEVRNVLSTYGKQVRIESDFHGTVANTLDAHRLIQHYQGELGPEVAENIVDSLYDQYFTQQAHPSAPETLLKAATAAGIDKTKAEAFVADKYEGLHVPKLLLREQVSNEIASASGKAPIRWSHEHRRRPAIVPYVLVDGKRRDLTLEGAKEVDEYLKTPETVLKQFRRT
ncbi:MAG: hypothetical protein LQ343_001925 [Gyalolechia ehrenbergii]|nr:MAG: hypothetical protein LQ343_001925 [Gyalolechia ehrenbergii]